jgi:hypothetical protein
LLHGSQVWFGKKFILLGSQLALPDTISREEMPALLEVFAHASGALRLPPSSGSSQAAPVLPSAQETAATITTMADMMAEIRALRALVQMPPATSVPVPPAGMPMFSMAQIEDMSRIFGPGGGGGMGGAGFAGPTTINVPPAQSESKRAELAKVLAVRPCFSQARFNQVWLVTDHDLNGRPATFSLSHATEVMRDIVTDLHGQYATPTTDAFLHNAVLLLWHTGEKGLLLDNFLLDKAKVVDWLTFQRAFFNMRRAYSLLCGEDLGTALGDFLFRLQEIFVAYPQIEIKTLLFLAESRLGRLRKLATTGDIATSL